jgi:hypothetical protein
VSWLLIPPAGPCGLAFERRAACRGLAVAWLQRGASAGEIPGIGRARHGSCPRSRHEKDGIPMAVMIGTGPHKASHTAVAISAAEEPVGQLQVRASASQAERPLAWAAAWPERAWAAGAPPAWAICWPGSCWPPGSGCWTCRPSSPPGCGCSPPGTRTRTTPTMPAQSRSPRCARPPSGMPAVTITRRCSRCGLSATGTWAGPAPRSPAGSTRCCAS